MNARHALRVLAWVPALVLTAASVRTWSTTPDPVPGAGLPSRAPGALPMRDSEEFAAAGARLRERNPFRLARAATSRRFSPWPEEELAALVPEPQIMPALTLGGIIGGPPWSALLEGVPGHESGIALDVGQEVNGVRLEQVRPDSVVLLVSDKTVILSLKQPWR